MNKKLQKICTIFITALILIFGMTVTARAASLGATRITSVKTKTSDLHKVSWKTVSGASGYQIAYKKGNGSYQYKKVTGGKRYAAGIDKRIPNVTYTYKVRAYKTKKKKTVYGPWSNAYTATLNKNIAVYGKEVPYETYGRFFQSQAQAQKNMRTITVKTWDFVSGKKGKKYTRTWYLTVHKNIADSVKRAFKEIYKGSEKFPIHYVGGWRWGTGRSEHYDGTAIDINPDENYQIRNGTILVGKLYKPGKNPYSIPKNGEVAKIFKKYGFSQGIWNSSQDYMHFSYFGT